MRDRFYVVGTRSGFGSVTYVGEKKERREHRRYVPFYNGTPLNPPGRAWVGFQSCALRFASLRQARLYAESFNRQHQDDPKNFPYEVCVVAVRRKPRPGAFRPDPAAVASCLAGNLLTDAEIAAMAAVGRVRREDEVAAAAHVEQEDARTSALLSLVTKSTPAAPAVNAGAEILSGDGETFEDGEG